MRNLDSEGVGLDYGCKTDILYIFQLKQQRVSDHSLLPVQSGIRRKDRSEERHTVCSVCMYKFVKMYLHCAELQRFPSITCITMTLLLFILGRDTRQR